MIEFISLVSQLSKDDFDDVRIERVMDIFYLDEQERKRSEAAWEYESERLSMINESERRGLERGLVEGEARGSHQAKVETARILKQLGDPVPKIMQATGLSEEEIEKINL